MSLVGAAPDAGAAPRCPECGFQVYNRRYAKCESCGTLLPESIVYSATERHALRVADDERALERARRESSTGDATPSSFDEAVLSAVIGLTES